MAPPKQTTLLSSMGFDDPDLKTPKHDAIVAWVADNAATIFPRPEPLLFVRRWDQKGIPLATVESLRPEDFTVPEVALALEPGLMNLKSLFGSFRSKPHEVVWEHPVYERWAKGRGRLVGFIDLMVSVPRFDVVGNVCEQTVVHEPGYTCLDTGAEYRPPETGAIRRQWRCLSPAEEETRRVVWNNARHSKRLEADPEIREKKQVFWIEIKPSIRSAGELFRQMNTYSSNAHEGEILCVASPDIRFRSRIEEQGYRFIEVPAEVANAPRVA